MTPEMAAEAEVFCKKYKVDFLGIIGGNPKDLKIFSTMCPMCAASFISMFLIVNGIGHDPDKELGWNYDSSNTQMH